MGFLELQGILKHFPGAAEPAVTDINLELTEGEVLALLGPSGCGKTTLLRLIAGLEIPGRGSIRLQDQELSTQAAHHRRLGMMFQDFALFPHLNVAQNIAFGLEMLGQEPSLIQTRVETLLQLVDLTGYGPRSVFSLSGGERQRVALARCLAPEPRLLMLDEPLASLDRRLRESLTAQLRRILKGMEQTAIYVTHDQREAFAIADRVAIMNRGRIEQIGIPEAIFARPANAFVARFLGLGNLLEARIAGVGTGAIESALGTWAMSAADKSSLPSDASACLLLVRPDAARPIGLGDAGFIELRGRILERRFEGTRSRFTLELPASDRLAPFEEEAHPARLELEWPARFEAGGHPLAQAGEAFTCAFDLGMMVLLEA